MPPGIIVMAPDPVEQTRQIQTGFLRHDPVGRLKFPLAEISTADYLIWLKSSDIEPPLGRAASTVRHVWGTVFVLRL